MRRFAAAFVFVFVTSLVLASYGHCWPMLAAQMDRQARIASSHDHGGHQKQHHHPTQGFGQELSVPGVQSGPVVIVHAPEAKTFAPILLGGSIADRTDAATASASFATAPAPVLRRSRSSTLAQAVC